MEPRCRCNHLAYVHGYGVRNGSNVRVACSASTCGCRLYEPGEPDHRCPTCGHPFSPIEAARVAGEDT